MNNSVSLIGYYGDDETIACSAWTSTSRDLTEEKRSRIGKMIQTLWKNGHETPFEKGVVHFLVNTDIASHIHLLKHRMSSLNSESAKYKELLEDKYYLPQDWKDILATDLVVGISQNDNSRVMLEKKNDKCSWLDILDSYTKLGNVLYHQCLKELTPILGRPRARESARYFKGYNMQYQADVMFNMRSFANFQKLRNSEHAQVEIREIAKEMLKQVKEIEGNPFKHTLEAISPNKPVVDIIQPKGLTEEMLKDYMGLMVDARRIFIEKDNHYWIIKSADHEFCFKMRFNKDEWSKESAIKMFKEEVYKKDGR